MKKNLLVAFVSILATLLLLESGWRAYYFLRNRNAEPEGAFALYAAGESSVAGFSDMSFVSVLERLYSGGFAGRKLYVDNLARRGFVAYYHRTAVRRAISFRKRANLAALIIYTGHNEPPHNPALTGVQKLWLRFGEPLAAKSYFLSDMLYLLWERGILQVSAPEGHEWYEVQLRHIIETARANGVQPFLATVASNMSGADPSLKLDDEGKFLSLARPGWELERKGRWLEARDYYKSMLEHYPAYAAHWHFRLGKCLEHMREYYQAREHYWLSADADPRLCLGKVDSIQTGIIRKLAVEYKIPLVDVVSAFEKNSPHGIMGSTLLGDGQHPNTDGVALLADVFSAALASGYNTPAAPPLGSAQGLKRLMKTDSDYDMKAHRGHLASLLRYSYLHKPWAEAAYEHAREHAAALKRMGAWDPLNDYYYFLLDHAPEMDRILGCRSGFPAGVLEDMSPPMEYDELSRLYSKIVSGEAACSWPVSRCPSCMNI